MRFEKDGIFFYIYMWIEISLSNHDYRKKVDVAKREMKKIKEYAERGYTHAVALDLSKYFDTLNHEKLLNLLRRDIKDERVIQWIKRYLKSGVMENGVVMETEEGSPQGGNISPLLANIYLNEFDQEYEKRGVKFVRYADDIVLLAKSDRAAKRLLETSTKYLEGTLKLKVNQEKSRVVSVRVYARWLNYYGVADMKKKIDDLNKWLYHRIRMCIWKQWKKPKTKIRNLLKMGVPKDLAWQAGNSRRGYWFVTHTIAVNLAMTKERLINSGFYDLATAYQSVHVNY